MHLIQPTLNLLLNFFGSGILYELLYRKLILKKEFRV